MGLMILGVLAGALTTLTGMGGGILLVSVLTLVSGPLEALAITAPALFVGNLHRALIFRAQIDRRVGLLFVLGALPGSLFGALMAVSVPSWLLNVVMVAMITLSLARALGGLRWDPKVRWMVPAAAFVGMVAATSGGAGLMVAPLLMATGLTGEAYVSTAALASLAMHLGRIVGYRAGGILTAHALWLATALSLAILCGNHLGARLRRYISPRVSSRLEVAVLLLATVLSLVGVAR